MTITYKQAGVDIDEAERFIKEISPLARTTFRDEVLTEIGLFAGLFKLDTSKYREPVLVSGTDGVGTKLKIAFQADRHDTVGIDLVAMCVNDILTVGAEPLFFLDYFATGKLKTEKAKEVLKGIVEGCRQAKCALIGGETAELPGFYRDDEYDLAGFAVGIVERDRIIDGSSINKGDVLVGVNSSGIHSNGLSLARKVLFEIGNYRIDSYIPELGTTIAEELLKPTIIYVDGFFCLKDKVSVKGMAHITGGGIVGNLPRILPQNCGAIVKRASLPSMPIFRLIQEIGKVSEEEMFRVFNMGIGYIFVLAQEDVDRALEMLASKGYRASVIGEVVDGERVIKIT